MQLETFTVYTVREVADSLKVSEHTVRQLIRTNKLSAMKVGRSYRVLKVDLNRYLRTMTSYDIV